VAVLALTALISALGLSFLESSSTVMPESINNYRMMRAHYLAESGVSLGLHNLMYPPTTVAANDYYQGAGNVAVDASIDYTDITVERSDAWSPPGTDPNLYRITAVGVAHDPAGAVGSKRSVTVEAIIVPPGKWQLPYALAVKSDAVLPPRTSFNGNVHGNGDLTGLGYCQGSVSAYGAASWPGTGPPASVTSNAAPFAAPPADPSIYDAYTVGGATFNAYDYATNDIDPSDADALNAMDMSATNPGRIIMAPTGTFTIRQDVRIVGTLVVDGDLKFHEATEIVAAADFPALIVTGNIVADRSSNAELICDGAVICGGAIMDDGNDQVRIEVTGACITQSGISLSKSDGTYLFTWDSSHSQIWDFENTSRQPYTLLSWKEN
jgi:hypothetical protein